jgi:hypothetical protein
MRTTLDVALTTPEGVAPQVKKHASHNYCVIPDCTDCTGNHLSYACAAVDSPARARQSRSISLASDG